MIQLRQNRAFPTAEGWGATTPGGTGGMPIVVTNLSDSGPGTLRAALEASGPRIITFARGGIIQLASRIDVMNPYITIDGSTAPAPGITISGVPGVNSTLLFIKTHDIIMRYVRLRNALSGTPGQGQVNLLFGAGAHDIIVDHCSLSWGQDETIDAFKHEEAPGEIFSITVQRCIISETLLPHSTAVGFGGDKNFLVSPPVEANRLTSHISLHHNVLAHNGHRNPLINCNIAEVINNIVYNWKDRVGEIEGHATADVYNNYWKPGRESAPNVFFIEVDNQEPFPSPTYQAYPPPDLFVAGNLVEGCFISELADNAALFIIVGSGSLLGGQSLPSNWRRLSPLSQPPWPVTIDRASFLMGTLLSDVGCTKPVRDPTDIRVLTDVVNGTGTVPTTPPENIWGGTPIPPPIPAPRWNGAIVAGVALGIGWLLGLFRRG